MIAARAKHSVECVGVLLFVAAHDEDEDLRRICMLGLYYSGWAGTESFMVAMSHHRSAGVRRLALEALAVRGFETCLPAAQRMIDDDDAENRELARGVIAGGSFRLIELVEDGGF